MLSTVHTAVSAIYLNKSGMFWMRDHHVHVKRSDIANKACLGAMQKSVLSLEFLVLSIFTEQYWLFRGFIK
jgi:hypothetical protein